jgi:hypothetical protein
VAAALLVNHSRNSAPARILRREAEILQAGAYMHAMQEKDSKSTRKSQLRVNQEPENKKNKDSGRSLSVWSQIVEVGWKYSGTDLGSDSGGLMLTGQRVEVGRLGLGPMDLG